MPDKEVEEMKEFMNILMEVKVSMADLNGKVDNLLDMKPRIESAYDTANKAEARSLKNEEDIGYLQDKVSNKAGKEDVERIVKQRENASRNLPAWAAVAISAIALILPFLNF